MAEDLVQTESAQNKNGDETRNPEDTSSNNAENTNQQTLTFDISELRNLNENSVINLTNKNYNNFTKDEKENCKIVKFSPDFTYDEILVVISKINASEYPNLFIFIIDADKFENFNQNSQDSSQKLQTLLRFLINIDENRQIILQIGFKNENFTKILFKDESSGKMLCIDHQSSNFETHNDFETFFMAIMNGSIDAIGKFSINDLLKAKNSCLILKFVRLFQISGELLSTLIQACGKIGTPNQLLAALDNAFGSNGNMFNAEAQEHFARTIKGDDGTMQSLLYDAVKNQNFNIVDFLVRKCTYLIQQLPHDHKIDISTVAFESRQYEILCDLLKFSDFPFPYKVDFATSNCERLYHIVNERTKFHDAIANQSKTGIQKFIKKYSDIKFAFDPENKSALSHALTSKAYEIFFLLKSLGFQSIDDVNYEKFLEGDELIKVRSACVKQMHDSVRTSAKVKEWSVLVLCAKSLIHNKKLSSRTEKKYRKKIQKWFRKIHRTKYGDILLDAAAQCNQLKFIFDFENKTVSNIRLATNAYGSTMPNFKWIMIGAEFSSKKRDQQIKGTIAHELCHYVMRMVFENNDNPHYENDVIRTNNFDEICIEINKWTTDGKKNGNQEDDKCEGIILTAFTEYKKELYKQELIVRVPHIYAHFDGDAKKVAYLENEYEKLFKFYELYVVPEMKKLNSKNRKFNKICELLTEIENSYLEFPKNKDISSIYSKNHVVVISNVPKLLLVCIYKQICQATKRQIIDDKNIFIKSQALSNSEIISEYKDIQSENADMNTYVDCTKESGRDISKIITTGPQKLIFVVHKEDQSTMLKQHLRQMAEDVDETFIKFEWNDISIENQKKLTQLRLNFQTKKCSLRELMTKENVEEDLELAEVIDDQLLNLLVEESKIFVNIFFIKELIRDTDFTLICKLRDFIKVTYHNESKIQKMSLEELIDDTINSTYILMSDVAGSGKTWALKSIAKYLMENFKTFWVAYVNLREFIKEFETMSTDVIFLTFMLENVLKNHQKFEANIFKKLYEIGKVYVLFDGFDEISPNHYDIVIKIIKSFKSNEGNQMWIATRDYLEADLKKQLGLDVTYKLDKFTNQDSIDFISSIWVLDGIEADKKLKLKSDGIKNFPNFKNYQEQARKLMEKFSKLQFSTIGFPQIYNMAAEVFKNRNIIEQDLNIYNIYKKFAIMHIKRWSKDQGELRKNIAAEAQTYKPNFMEVHQILSMKSLFPHENEIFNLKYSEHWSNEKITGCGIVTMTENKFVFIDVSFRNFFAVNFIFIQLKHKEYFFIKFFMKFVTISSFEIIRLYVNDALADESIQKKLRSKLPKIVEYFDKNITGDENISFIFNEKLENVAKLMIELLKKSDNENVKKMIENNAQKILEYAPEMTNNFHDILNEFLILNHSKLELSPK